MSVNQEKALGLEENKSKLSTPKKKVIAYMLKIYTSHLFTNSTAAGSWGATAQHSVWEPQVRIL